MIESIKKILLTASIFASSSLFAQTTIPWTGTPGEVEAAIVNAGGEGDFVLEAGKIYFMTAQVLVEAGKVLKVSGATADGVQKASLQLIEAKRKAVVFPEKVRNLFGLEKNFHLQASPLKIPRS